MLRIIPQFIPLLLLLVYCSTYFNWFENRVYYKRVSDNSPGAVLVSSRTPKIKLLKKYHYESGWQLILEERFEEALSFLKPILHEDPSFKRTGFLIGYAYQKSDKIEEAISTYETYLINDKQDFQALFNLAHAYMDTDQCIEAIEVFNKTLNQKPDYFEVHLHLSTCHSRQGDAIKANQHLKIWNSRDNTN